MSDDGSLWKAYRLSSTSPSIPAVCWWLSTKDILVILLKIYLFLEYINTKAQTQNKPNVECQLMSRHQGVFVLSFKFAVFGKPVFSQLASFTTHFALSKIDRVTTVYMQEVV